MVWPPHVPFAFATGAAVAAAIANTIAASAATKARPPTSVPPKRTLIPIPFPQWCPELPRGSDPDDNSTGNVSLDRGILKLRDNMKRNSESDGTLVTRRFAVGSGLVGDLVDPFAVLARSRWALARVRAEPIDDRMEQFPPSFKPAADLFDLPSIEQEEMAPSDASSSLPWRWLALVYLAALGGALLFRFPAWAVLVLPLAALAAQSVRGLRWPYRFASAAAFGAYAAQ